MTDIFDDLKDYNNIIAFEEIDETLNFFEKYNPSKVCYLDLSKYPEIKDKFKYKFDIKAFPCMISFGKVIYLDDDLESNLISLYKKEIELYKSKIHSYITNNKCFVFIKGTVAEPKCKFTRRLLNCFNELNLVYMKDYDFFNILSDEKMREVCKVYSNWMTYPQIYIEGKFFGGIDILEESIANKTIYNYIKH